MPYGMSKGSAPKGHSRGTSKSLTSKTHKGSSPRGHKSGQDLAAGTKRGGKLSQQTLTPRPLDSGRFRA